MALVPPLGRRDPGTPELRPTFVSGPSACAYLPDRSARTRYELAFDLTAPEFFHALQAGWRRFGPVMFKPECPSCSMCQSLRVPVAEFRPTASQRRAWNRNRRDVALQITEPTTSEDRIDLFRRFHGHGARTKQWPARDTSDLRLFISNPFATEEWDYYVGDRLVGVGYVDVLPAALSAIYFCHDPEEHRRGLGTFNILTLIEAARARGLAHFYLGYYVEGCRSLEYKARFTPNEILTRGAWERFC
jgi:arginine-tRNA-protein transferase